MAPDGSRPIRVMALVFSALATMAICADAEGTDPLWRKAVAVAAAGDSVVPGIIDAKLDFLDSDGNVQNTKETWTRVSLDPDGEIETATVRVVENGKEIPVEKPTPEDSAKAARERVERKARNKNDPPEDEGFSINFGNHPFRPEDQDRVTATPSGESKSIDGLTCVGYSFTRKEKDRVMKGTAWLQDSTGVPIELKFTEDPLPKHVKHMVTTARWSTNGPFGWHLKDAVIEGMGGFLFIKKRVRVTSTFSEYWRIPQPADRAGK